MTVPAINLIERRAIFMLHFSLCLSLPTPVDEIKIVIYVCVKCQ